MPQRMTGYRQLNRSRSKDTSFRRTEHENKYRVFSSVIETYGLSHLEAERVYKTRYYYFKQKQKQHKRKLTFCEKIVVLRDEEKYNKAGENKQAENGIENRSAFAVHTAFAAVFAALPF
jgi:hypothetical protein